MYPTLKRLSSARRSPPPRSTTSGSASPSRSPCSRPTPSPPRPTPPRRSCSSCAQARHRQALNYLSRSRSSSCVLLAIVVTSYRQTIYAYPNGGGTYVVQPGEPRRRCPSLVAGASLLVDYIAHRRRVGRRPACCRHHLGASTEPATVPRRALPRASSLMTLANLRGMKESGKSSPARRTSTSSILFALIAFGLYQFFVQRPRPDPDQEQLLDRGHRDGEQLDQSLALLMLLRAFSSGAVALSGVEAISNGVPAFKKPESRNAAQHADGHGHHPRHAASSASRSWPTTSSRPRRGRRQTALSTHGAVPSSAARASCSTMPAVLHLRHPHPGRQHRLRRLPPPVVDHRPRRLPAPPARQPRRPAGVLQRHHRPRRAWPALLIVAFGGNITRPDPALRRRRVHRFTLRQAGMVVHHLQLREPGWQRGSTINAVGAVATGVVRSSWSSRSSPSGAWIPAVVIPADRRGASCPSARHYDRVRDADRRARRTSKPRRHTAHRRRARRQRSTRACSTPCSYARSLAPDRLIAVSVVHDADEQEAITDGVGQAPTSRSSCTPSTRPTAS